MRVTSAHAAHIGEDRAHISVGHVSIKSNRLTYLVLDANGGRLAGTMAAVQAGLGWSLLNFEETSGEVGHLRGPPPKLAAGGLLAVGKGTEPLDDIGNAILEAFAAAFAAVLVVRIAGGPALSRFF